MKLLWGHKDGGPDSNVRCWGLEIKSLGSVLLLCFGEGSREAFHSHAFNAVSWLIRGRLLEMAPKHLSIHCYWYKPSWTRIKTARHWFHRVEGIHVRNWVLTFRGPWVKTWKDGQPGQEDTLTHGRKLAGSRKE